MLKTNQVNVGLNPFGSINHK